MNVNIKKRKRNVPSTRTRRFGNETERSNGDGGLLRMCYTGSVVWNCKKLKWFTRPKKKEFCFTSLTL